MVYVIADKEKRYMKIGKANNPKSRLATIQTSMPFDVEIVAQIIGNYSIENRLHKLFKHLRLRGEWFTYSDEILKHVVEKLHVVQKISDFVVDENELYVYNLVDTKYNNIAHGKRVSTPMRKKIGDFLGIDEDDVRGIFHSLADRGLIYSMAHESYVSGNVMINYWERMRMPHEKELIKTRIIEISDFMDNSH